MRADALRAVSLGTWLEGFEERRPGVLGGWVDAAGSAIGVEIALDGGGLRVGEYIRDAGSPIASGRWAFGWTASRRGFETTDGGMTWSKDISLPDRVSDDHADTDRARRCGRLGCIAAGWLRIGWGQAELPDIPAPPPPRPVAVRGLQPPWKLRCQPLDPPARDAEPPAHASPHGTPPTPPTPTTWGAVPEFPPFAGRPGPSMRPEDVGFTTEATYGLERALRSTPIGRLYTWGPSSGDWDATAGRWQIRWDWAWGGWRDARASAPAAAPWPGPDAARHALGIGPGAGTVWIVAPGEDADHALLLERRPPSSSTSVSSTDLVVLERDKPPLAVARPGGEPFADVESAVHVGGRWYIVTAGDTGDAPASVVWEVDGGWARERVRVSRAGTDGHAEARLARRTDGRALALVVEGQPDVGRPPGLWVTSLDLESRAAAEPEVVASVPNRSPAICTIDDTGWEFDIPYSGAIELEGRGGWDSPLQTPLVHVRASRDRFCIDRVTGAVGAFSATAPAALSDAHGTTMPTPARAGTVDVSVFSARARFGLRCTPADR
jgi:hypothetical protein